MDEFIGEDIEVEQSPSSPQPVRFTWRGEVHEVVEVLRQRVDVTFGDLPPRSRKWFTRRHRRCYVVKDGRGDVYEMYLDYSNRKKVTWHLVRRISAGG
ncbi:MAG: DUF6504 family protein [Phycisphaerae bacterium]